MGEKLPVEKDERDQNAVNSGHLVPCSAHKPIGPICCLKTYIIFWYFFLCIHSSDHLQLPLVKHVHLCGACKEGEHGRLHRGLAQVGQGEDFPSLWYDELTRRASLKNFIIFQSWKLLDIDGPLSLPL